MNNSITEIMQDRLEKFKSFREILKEQEKTKALTSEHTFDCDIVTYYRYQQKKKVNEARIELLEDLVKLGRE
jgi:uncharacterized protein YktA (UPF0223 family)